MSSTPIYDQLLIEEGPPMVTIWYVDTDGIVTIEGEPRFVTQFEAALAMDTLSDQDKATVSLQAENESVRWWTQRWRPEPHLVDPMMTAEAIVLSEQIEDDLRFMALEQAVNHAAFSPRAG